MFKSLQLKGRFMYERDECLNLIKLVELGLLKLGPETGPRTVGTYPLEEWDKAFTEAEIHSGYGAQVLLAPGMGSAS
jgi:hypothetical protein